MKIVKIYNKDYKLEQSLGAQMLFDKMTNGNTQIGTTTNIIMLLYCMLRYKNKDTFNYTVDEFCDILDEQPDIISVFTDYLVELQKEQAEYLESELKKKMELIDQNNKN